MASVSKDFWNFRWEERPDSISNTCACSLFRVEDVKDKKILDVGCGNAAYSGLDAFTDKFTGVDISINALRYSTNIDPELKVAVCDAKQLPFRDDEFDSVFSIDMMSLLGRGYYKALEEMRRVTKDVIVFNVAHTDRVLTYLARKILSGNVKFVDHESCVVIEEPGIPDRIFFDETNINLALEKLDLIPDEVRILTANEENNIGAPTYKQCNQPDMEFRQSIFVRALKRK